MDLSWKYTTVSLLSYPCIVMLCDNGQQLKAVFTAWLIWFRQWNLSFSSKFSFQMAAYSARIFSPISTHVLYATVQRNYIMYITNSSAETAIHILFLSDKLVWLGTYICSWLTGLWCSHIIQLSLNFFNEMLHRRNILLKDPVSLGMGKGCSVVCPIEAMHHSAPLISTNLFTLCLNVVKSI